MSTVLLVIPLYIYAGISVWLALGYSCVIEDVWKKMNGRCMEEVYKKRIILTL
jgi:hypothetical protein